MSKLYNILCNLSSAAATAKAGGDYRPESDNVEVVLWLSVDEVDHLARAVWAIECGANVEIRRAP